MQTALAPAPGPARKNVVAHAPTRATPHVQPRATAPAPPRSAAVSPDSVHVVRPRDTVSSIAKKYGVSVAEVLRWNRLEEQTRIRPGDRLRVADVRPSVEHDGQGGFR
jgi:LysM repeat protein